MRIAAFQRFPLFDDITGIVSRLCEDLAWCDAQSVDLALFPEAYLQGYAIDRETIARRALSLGDETMADVFSSLTPFKATLVLGTIERRDALLLNTALVIREGRPIGAYAKTRIYEPGFDAGSDYPVFERDGWRFGINICNDANFAEPALAVARQGARLICYPLNNMLRPKNAEKWRARSPANLSARARETGCWVVSADVVGQHADQLSYGCSCVVDPRGSIRDCVPEGEEGTLLFDLA
jgi:predicted amidohydrolase